MEGAYTPCRRRKSRLTGFYSLTTLVTPVTAAAHAAAYLALIGARQMTTVLHTKFLSLILAAAFFLPAAAATLNQAALIVA